MRADKRRPLDGGPAVPLLIAVALGACGTPAKAPDKPAAPADPWGTAIAAQVKPYLRHQIVTGVAIGIIDGERQWFYGFGSAGNTADAPTATTLFELGAITNVYTGVLLADAIERHVVELDTPVSTLLPLGVTVPTRDEIAITLQHLITHSAGLPALAPGLRTIAPVKYGEDALFADLARTRLGSPPGRGFLVSNYGVTVLGVALAHKLGANNWSVAIDDRVLEPLGLTDTVVAVPAGQSGRHAVGHSDDGKVVPFSAFGVVAAAIGLRSTVTDQLAFLRANFDAAAGKPGPLAAALRRTHEIVVPGQRDQVALGWFVDDRGRRFHNGQTDGFHAFIQMDLDKRRGVVILAATATSLVDQLGDTIMDILAKARPVPPKFPSPEQMMPLVGTYKITGHDDTITIELAGVKLYARTTDGTQSRLMPAGGRRFYLEKDRAFVTFEGTPATRFTIEALGGKIVAERVTGDSPDQPAKQP
jgi:CubicO group peptidase (beta-lactamase class C family)